MMRKIWLAAALGLGTVAFATPAFANSHMESAKNNPQLMQKLQGELGGEWNVAVEHGALVASRKQPQAAESDMHSKVQDQIQDLRQSDKKMNAHVKGDTAKLSGKIDDCSKLPETAQDFASIQGINKIVIDARCGK